MPDDGKKWNGEERRKETPKDLGEVWELLHEINLKFTTHIELEEQVKPQIAELIQLLDRSKGILTFLRWSIYVVGVVGAAIIWAKDHLK